VGNLLKSLSLMPSGLRHKLFAVIGLMVVVPLGVLFIFAALLLPGTKSVIVTALDLVAQSDVYFFWWVFLLLVAASVMVAAGLRIVSGIIGPILEIASGARTMAGGNLDQVVEVKREDELGDISAALNQLTLRARKHMEELRQYSEQSKVINIEIHKRTLAMAGILQVGNLVSQAADLEMILELALKQLAMIEEGSFAFLHLVRERFGGLELKAVYNMNPDILSGIQLKPLTALIDDQQRPTEELRDLYERLGGANVAIQPVVIRDHEIGILGVGNHALGYTFTPDYLELLTVFAKQIAIAVENDRLVRETGELAVKDELTGLYNEHYVRTRLDEEIKRAIAYQRPCAFVLFEIDEFQHYCDLHGKTETERMLKKLGWILLESVTEVDRVGRFGGNAFAMLLPERNKRQAAELAEAVRKRVAFAFSGETDITRRITLSGGVSENPIDGVTAEDLVAKAQEAIGDAKIRGKNCVVA